MGKISPVAAKYIIHANIESPEAPESTEEKTD